MSTAWVTLATTDGYAIGALVLAQSLRNVSTQHKLHVLYTSGVSFQMRQQLHLSFDYATEVNVLDSKDKENLALINRPDLGVTFTKLHCWRLTQYSKCIFLDADTFVLQNSDELFEHPEIAAAPDIGWPDYFNSGVFVFVPSNVTYQNLMHLALSHGSFDGGDQGLLNKYFCDWRKQDVNHRLSFLYNVSSNAIYSYAAAIKRHAADIKILHFLGKEKPWHTNVSNAIRFEYFRHWRKVYTESVEPRLNIGEVTIANEIMTETFTIGSQLKQDRFSGPLALTSTGSRSDPRFEAWEIGQPDYMGLDAYSNIEKAIEKSLQ